MSELSVDVGADSVSATYDAPEGDQHSLFVAAHGAGGNMNDRGMLAVTNALKRVGVGVVRFNFLYTEKKSGRPDPMPKLMECVRAVVERARSVAGAAPLLIGGRSMGGRVASMLAATGFDADGLLLLAYPLHPAGAPEKLRDAHLPDITMPVLCLNGTRDALCRRDLMEDALRRVRTRWTMHWLEGADHSFHVLKSSGRTDAEVLDDIAVATQRWCAGLAGRG